MPVAKNKYELKGRKLQIAIERGLVKAPEGILVPRIRKGMSAFPTHQRKDEEDFVAPQPERVNPCANCQGGRHKVQNGWCIDGRYWTHAEIHSLKYIKVMAGEETMNVFMSPQVLALKDALNLEFVEARIVRVP